MGNEDMWSTAWMHIYMTKDSVGPSETAYLEKGSVCVPSMTLST